MAKIKTSLKIFSITDKGMERDHNEDWHSFCTDLTHSANFNNDWCFWTKTPALVNNISNYGVLLIVADGMGGLNAGEVASRVAVEGVQTFFNKNIDKTKPLEFENIGKILKQSILFAQEGLVSHQKLYPETKGMGTTIVIAWVINNYLHVEWCGDSRCYIFNEIKGLQQLSKDHSYVQELIDKGKLTTEQAFYHPDSNIITQSLGDEKREPFYNLKFEDFYIVHRLSAGDRIILCSDGLNSMLQDSKIFEIVNQNKDIELCSKELINAANKAGGHDNITVIVCDALTVEESDTKIINKNIFKSKKNKLFAAVFFIISCIIVLFALKNYNKKPPKSITNSNLTTDSATTVDQKGSDTPISLVNQSYINNNSLISENTIIVDSIKIKDKIVLKQIIDSLIILKNIIKEIESNFNNAVTLKLDNSENFSKTISETIIMIDSLSQKKKNVSIKDLNTMCSKIDELLEIKKKLKISDSDFNKSIEKLTKFKNTYLHQCKTEQNFANTKKTEKDSRANVLKKIQCKDTKKWGFMNNKGDTVIACKYELVYDFLGDNLAAAKLNKKWGFIDKNGNEVIPFIYDEAIKGFDKGFAIVVQNKKKIKINVKNEIIN